MATHLEFFDADRLDKHVSTKLIVGDGDEVGAGCQLSPQRYYNSLDDLDKVDFVLGAALLEELLAEVVAVRGVAERLGPLKNDSEEILSDGHGRGLTETSLA